MQSFHNRKQFVSINGINSVIENVTYGIAQGSTLSPLLFLLYINDLYCSTNCFLQLLADDTCLVINNPELSTLENVMNKDLASIYTWLQANKLHLNPAKSNYSIVAPKITTIPSQICLTLNNTKISNSNYVKYLGATTTDRDKLNANQLIENKLTANNADWLRRAILNIFLLSPEPSCPNPHIVMKSLRRNQQRNHCNQITALRSVCSRSVCRGQLTWLEISRSPYRPSVKLPSTYKSHRTKNFKIYWHYFKTEIFSPKLCLS